MSEIPDRLPAALAGRYVIERELGRGGNATVYLAHDIKHDRQVALKVLLPELAQSVRTERFLREIQIAAKLHHPHVLMLIDSGEAGGFLYYVMPYVEGESLRHRLQRERQLPLDDALQIAREVADALSYAHRRDLVHRDIKPENILLQEGHAVVADFGIARALSEAGGQSVTATGIAVGTPVYMSPEQGAGSRTLDGRSDIYSLGCVVYEMLAGTPPFTGETPQEILAHHALDSVAPLRKQRPEVPIGVSLAVEKALAKKPAERFGTAAEFAGALLTVPSLTARFRAGARRRRMRAVAAAAAMITALITLFWWRLTAASAALDPSVIAILPFRVTGSDSTTRILREGMVDLLAAKLGNEGGLRARDPQTVLSAWRRALVSESEDLDEHRALELARRLGAGRLLLGGVITTPGRIAMTATLLRVSDGARQGAASVAGRADSLTDLVDHLFANLLARGAGVAEASVSSLTTTSLPALEAYLAGRAASRRGRLTEAVDDVDNALQIDSTFAAAAMAMAVWAPNLEGGGRLARGRRLAWLYRDRLSSRDRALLPAFLYGDYPPRLLHGIEDFRNWERAVEIAPDQPGSWTGYGTRFMIRGHTIDVTAPLDRAAAAFRRAFQLDSGYAFALQGLVSVSLLTGDTAAARRYLGRYVALDSAGDLTDVLRWLVALATRDDKTRAQLQDRFDSLPIPSLQRIVGYAQLTGTGLEDAERAATILRRAPNTRGGQWTTLWRLHQFALNRGRPLAALALTEAMEEVEPAPGAARVVRVLDGLYWDGDTIAAARAAGRLLTETTLTRSTDQRERQAGFQALCAVELWRLAHGDRTTAARTVASLQAAGEEMLRTAGDTQSLVARETMSKIEFCLPAIEMELAGPTGGAEASRALLHLDSLTAVGGTAGQSQAVIFDRILPLVAARWHERARQFSAARTAFERRPVWDYREATTAFLSSYLVGEGRAAALTGDRDGAIRGYEHYLALRSDPEPSLRPAMERIRAELARLVGEPRSP